MPNVQAEPAHSSIHGSLGPVRAKPRRTPLPEHQAENRLKTALLALALLDDTGFFKLFNLSIGVPEAL